MIYFYDYQSLEICPINGLQILLTDSISNFSYDVYLGLLQNTWIAGEFVGCFETHYIHDMNALNKFTFDELIDDNEIILDLK